MNVLSKIKICFHAGGFRFSLMKLVHGIKQHFPHRFKASIETCFLHKISSVPALVIKGTYTFGVKLSCPFL